MYGEIQILNVAAKRILNIDDLKNISDIEHINKELHLAVQNLRTGGSELIKIAHPDGIMQLSVYVIELEAKRTLAGPPVAGRVRALIVAHTEANEKYVKSIELFVLRPVENFDAGESKSPLSSLISLSPRHSGGKYCLDTDPNSLGL